MSDVQENPFSPQFGRRPKLFIGRDSIVGGFVGNIENLNSPNRTTILTGIRGTGKTAILSDVHSILEKRDYLIIDVTAFDGMLAEMLDQFARKAKKRLGKRADAIKGLTVGALGLSVGLTRAEPDQGHGFRYLVESALDSLKKEHIGTVFLIDEVHNSTPDMREFAIAYQHLLREEFDVSLLMAGLPSSVNDILNDKVLTFLRRSHRVELENVSTEVVEIAYEEAFGVADRHLTRGCLKAAAQASSGYPYLMQLIGYYLWESETGDIAATDVKRAVQKSKIELYQNVHDLLYRDLSKKDKEFITAMAKDDHESETGVIAQRMGVSLGYISKYKGRLTKAGIIHSSSHGKVAFTLPFMKEYLQSLKHQ
jgi:hypothetical protein